MYDDRGIGNIVRKNIFTDEWIVDDFDPEVETLDDIVSFIDVKSNKRSYWITFGEPWWDPEDEDEWNEWEGDGTWDVEDDEEYEDDGVWWDGYESEEAFWDCNGI